MRRLKRERSRYLKKRAKRQRRLGQVALNTGAAAIIALSGQILLNQKAIAARMADPHLLEVPGDTDQDMLATWEELVLGYNAINPDENQNGIEDGKDLALQSVQMIQSLPVHHSGEPIPDGIYITEYLTFGLEQCHICGEEFNMGGIMIYNPTLHEEASICFLGLHFLEHGSFSHSGTVHEGRIDVPTLARLLEIDVPNQGNHQVPVATDSDNDMVTDHEEHGLGYEPFDADQNDNSILDGGELAQQAAAKVRELISSAPTPGYEIVRHELDGLEQCHICGEQIHMGGTEIVNTILGIRYPEEEGIFLPDLSLHSMEHGSFDYFGTEHLGRTELNLLMRVLEMRFPHNSDEHELPLNNEDLDKDQISNAEEIKAKLNLYDPDQNDNLTPDGVDLAKQCKRAMDDLPVYETPPTEPEGPYKINYFQKGLEQCHVCGENVNMGYWEIVNPNLGLSMEVSDIVCHYMEHGAFEYNGDIHGRGRIDVNTLLAILEMPVKCGDLGTVYRPADLNKDCHVNLQDVAEIAEQWLKDTEP